MIFFLISEKANKYLGILKRGVGSGNKDIFLTLKSLVRPTGILDFFSIVPTSSKGYS